MKQTSSFVSGENGTLVLLQCLNGGVVDTENNICTCENGFTGSYCETGLYFLRMSSVDSWHWGYEPTFEQLTDILMNCFDNMIK